MRIHSRLNAPGFLGLMLASLVSCSGRSGSFVPSAGTQPSQGSGIAADYSLQAVLPNPIQHVLIIVQENRTPDFLFQGIPGADIAQTATDWRGQKIALHPVTLATQYDLGHSQPDFIRDYDGGKMDGFDQNLPDKYHLRPYAYGISAEVYPYRQMALQYVLADHMFQSNEGPSYPAHLYLISGTATGPSISSYRVSSNPRDGVTGRYRNGGCDDAPTTEVKTVAILDGSPGPNVFTCFDRPVLSDFLDAKRVSWRYYQQDLGPGLWHAFDSIKHVRYGPDYANVITPPQTVLSDITGGRLAGVSWVIPGSSYSDHAGRGSTNEGPAWVASIVNAVGKSKYWRNTAIFVTWDDWGGWYDHVKPPILNGYELGVRVPLLVISPYARRGYVSKVQHEFGSILAFTEEIFGIPKGSLKATDRRADDLMDAFDFTQAPRPFQPIVAPPFHPPPGDLPNEEDP